MFIKCADYIFDSAATSVQIQDDVAKNGSGKLITITGMIKAASSELLNNEVQTITKNLYSQPVTLYYPTSLSWLEADLKSFVYTPDINGKSCAFEIKLRQVNDGSKQGLVHQEFNDCANGSRVVINYSGTKECGAKIEITPSNGIANLVIKTSHNKRSRFLGALNAGSILSLDYENAGVLLDKINAWPAFRGDLPTLRPGDNEFTLEFDGNSIVKFVIDYEITHW